MGLFDKAKDMAGKAKDKVDDVVDKRRSADKAPDPAKKATAGEGPNAMSFDEADAIFGRRTEVVPDDDQTAD